MNMNDRQFEGIHQTNFDRDATKICDDNSPYLIMLRELDSKTVKRKT